jgi:hypothetical protein
MVMRFEKGRSFEDWLKGLGRPPTQAELDAIVAPLLDALQMMHAENFLHRDIAPDNIIIRADGSPVLLDFGAARRAVAERSRALTGIVKAGYSPNEQYASDSRLQGPWSDFYALGGTLYRAVTDKIPEEATLRVTDDRTPGVASIAKGTYRPGFLAAIDACLNVRPADRPQSVAQLRPMLFASGPPPKSRPKPVPTPEPKPARHVEAPAAGVVGRRSLAIVALLVVLGGAYGGYEYARWASQERVRLDTEIANKAAQEAKQRADAAAAKKRADEEELAKAQAEARRKAELAEREARLQSEAAAAKKKADDEHKAKTQVEARRKAELAEQEAAKKRADEAQQAEARRRAEEDRRRQEASLGPTSFDGVWEITRVGKNCFANSHVFGVAIANGSFAQGFGTVSPSGEFKLQGRSLNTGRRDLQYTGKLTGTSGEGTFQADTGTCAGTFTAKRRG